jgi:transposase
MASGIRLSSGRMRSRLYRTSGKSLATVCAELGIAVESLRKWVKQADLDSGARKDGLTSEDRVELNKLRRENRILVDEPLQ